MTTAKQFGRPVNILLVEDNPGDVRLMQECLKDVAVATNLSVVGDVHAATDYLHRRGTFSEATRPDLVFLDLCLPGEDGREFLAQLKNDERFAAIPVIVLTTSECERDIAASYRLRANCYLKKPAQFEQFSELVLDLERFWFTIAQLPNEDRDDT